MARIALVTWAGGGNVGVVLGIGVALAARGHIVTVLGPRSLRASIEGLRLAYAELGIMPPREPEGRSAYLLEVAGATAMADDLRRLAAALRIDAIVIDCNLSWALQSRIEAATAVVVHTALGLYLPVWQAVLDTANRQRAVRGLPALAPAADAWAAADRLLVASLPLFDRPLESPGLNPAYTGPVATPARPMPAQPPGPGPGCPTILISYSTESLQNDPRRVQTALDALAKLPVRVMASTSGVFPAAQLRVPANATVADYLPHESVVQRMDLAVCHAGHGTVMAALSHGVPLVCVPGLGRDQAPIAARVAELGLGVALAGDASPQDINRAVMSILGDRRYRLRTRRFAQRAGHRNGAQRAAMEIEDMARSERVDSGSRPSDP